jgi:PhnB protein
MATVNIYLTFDGECEEAFKFYESVFGTEIPMWNKFGECHHKKDATIFGRT